MLGISRSQILIAAAMLTGSTQFVHAQAAAGGAWRSYNSPAGFSVQLPPGWAAESAKDGHVLLHSADRTVFAVAQPFKAPNGGASADWIEPLVQHMGGLFAGAVVSRKTQVSEAPDEAIARVSYTANGKPGVANVLCAITGGSGMFYGIAAPAGRFAAVKPTLIHSLSSFHYGAPAAPANPASRGTSPGPVSYVRWKEPNEGVFTTETPKGWKIAGSYRFAPVDVRTQIQAASPDGAIRIQCGDAGLGAFAAPGPSSQVRGLHEGQSYEVNGVTYVVLRPQTGAQFSRSYVQQKLAKAHPGLEVSDTEELPAEAEKFNRENAARGAQSHDTVGRTDFSYTQDGRTMNGRCFVRTQPVGQGLGAIWLAYPTIVTAPAGSLELGISVMQHMLDHTRIDPDWQAQSTKTAAEFSKMVMRNHEAAMAELRRQYDRAIKRLDDNHRQWENIINGETDLVDPGTGQTFKGQAGSNFYWKGVGGIVGSQAGAAPSVNLTPLKQF
jgi:hypothetical protein